MEKKFLLALIVTQLVKAAEVPTLYRECIPCLAFGGRYCADDEMLVNLNADKCYSSSGDKAKNCGEFDFYSNSMLCSEEDFTTSSACDILSPERMDYYNV
jgi:hypothetical protein